jgi:hypothetical protein
MGFSAGKWSKDVVLDGARTRRASIPLKQQGYWTDSRNETATAAESVGGHTIAVTLGLFGALHAAQLGSAHAGAP